MNRKLIQHAIAVKKSPIHGYGVFAEKNILPNDIIEECHYLKVKEYDTYLTNYYFEENENAVIVLGFGSIYNHSDHPNASYEFDLHRELLVFKATRLIQQGEEIFCSYGKTWFNKRSIVKKEISLARKGWRFVSRMPLRAAIVIGILYLLIYGIRILTY